MTRTDQLISGYLLDTLTPEEHRQLNDWIKADRAHARHFATETIIHRRLREQFRSAAQLRRLNPPAERLWIRPLILGAAAVMLLSITLAWWMFETPQSVRITAQHQARWRDDAGLQTGRMVRLEAGLVRLQFTSGATALIEGPASFQTDGTTLALHAGRAVVRCPTPKSREMIVRAGDAILTDRGTEFGVAVDEAGRGVVHVIEGQIEAQTGAQVETRIDIHSKPPNPTASGPKSVVLSAGDVASLHDLTLVADPSAVAALRKIARTDLDALASDDARLAAWAAAKQTLLEDPSLAFAASRRHDVAVDLVSLKPLTGLSRPSAAASRFAGQEAWAFTTPSQTLRGSLPQAFDTLTFAAWVRLNDEDRDAIRHRGIIMSDGWGKAGQVHWQCKGRDFRLSYFDRGDEIDPRFAAAPQGLLNGNWHLLVTTVRRLPKMEVTHYLDGKPAYRRTFETPPPPLTLNAFSIGGWSSGQPQTPDRTLNGAVEDVLIWNRVLSDTDVQRLFEESRP